MFSDTKINPFNMYHLLAELEARTTSYGLYKGSSLTYLERRFPEMPVAYYLAILIQHSWIASFSSNAYSPMWFKLDHNNILAHAK
jgi:hypothetical protein